MNLWIKWWGIVKGLRPAFSRMRSFLWFAACLAGITVRPDLMGVSSIIRALGLKGFYYDRILDFFHSPALNLDKLTRIWKSLIMECSSLLLRVNGRILLVGDV